jgi:hypothetical protein
VAHKSQPESVRRVWLVYSTKLTPSRDNVAAKPRGDWGGGYTEFAGFVVVHYKTEASTGGDGIQVCRKLRGGGHVAGLRGLCWMEARLRQRCVRPMGISTT